MSDKLTALSRNSLSSLLKGNLGKLAAAFDCVSAAVEAQRNFHWDHWDHTRDLKAVLRNTTALISSKKPGKWEATEKEIES